MWCVVATIKSVDSISVAFKNGSCTIVITWIRYDVAVNEDGELGVGDKLGWCYVVNF